MGPLNSGKSNVADHTPDQLDAAGLSYEERAVTDDFGGQQVKFTVERPESGE